MATIQLDTEFDTKEAEKGFAQIVTSGKSAVGEVNNQIASMNAKIQATSSIGIRMVNESERLIKEVSSRSQGDLESREKLLKSSAELFLALLKKDLDEAKKHALEIFEVISLEIIDYIKARQDLIKSLERQSELEKELRDQIISNAATMFDSTKRYQMLNSAIQSGLVSQEGFINALRQSGQTAVLWDGQIVGIADRVQETGSLIDSFSLSTDKATAAMSGLGSSVHQSDLAVGNYGTTLSGTMPLSGDYRSLIDQIIGAHEAEAGSVSSVVQEYGRAADTTGELTDVTREMKDMLAGQTDEVGESEASLSGYSESLGTATGQVDSLVKSISPMKDAAELATESLKGLVGEVTSLSTFTETATVPRENENVYSLALAA